MKLVQSVTCVRVTLSVFLLLLGFARSFRLPCSPFTSNKNPLTSSFARRINLRPSLALNQRDARHRVSLRSGNGGAHKLAMKNEARVYSEEERLRPEEDVSDFDFWTAAGLESDLAWNLAALHKDLAERRLLPGGRVLDLMAGAETQVSGEVAYSVFGVGLVDAHLAANPLLDDSLSLDLNAPGGVDLEGALRGKGLEPGDFSGVVCSGALPYLTHPEHVLKQGARMLSENGVLLVSWTTSVREAKVTRGWASMDSAEQLDFVKQCLVAGGLSAESLRVEVSGPTHGEKLVLVSAANTAAKGGLEADAGVKSKVSGAVLKEAMRTQRRSRRDRQRQKEQDEKPFRLKIISPPPAQLLEGTFQLPPRTHNGDKVEVQGRRYVVSKVQYTYSYRGGRYRLDEKVLEVQQQQRYETNERLKTLLKHDDAQQLAQPDKKKSNDDAA